MNAGEIKHMFESDLSSVPGAAGVSNHMGSRFSADEGKMRVLLSLVKQNNVFYFDSYTTPKSKAAVVAKRLGLPTARNQMFTDVKDDPVSVQHQFDVILKKFATADRFIAIGHIQKKHVAAVLKKNISRFKEQGIEFVYLPELVGQK
jgi:hypothetical protein